METYGKKLESEIYSGKKLDQDDMYAMLREYHANHGLNYLAGLYYLIQFVNERRISNASPQFTYICQFFSGQNKEATKGKIERYLRVKFTSHEDYIDHVTQQLYVYGALGRYIFSIEDNINDVALKSISKILSNAPKRRPELFMLESAFFIRKFYGFDRIKFIKELSDCKTVDYWIKKDKNELYVECTALSNQTISTLKNALKNKKRQVRDAKLDNPCIVAVDVFPNIPLNQQIVSNALKLEVYNFLKKVQDDYIAGVILFQTSGYHSYEDEKGIGLTGRPVFIQPYFKNISLKEMFFRNANLQGLVDIQVKSKLDIRDLLQKMDYR